MRGITLSADEIEAAPPGVRRWLEQEIACTVGRLATADSATLALSSSDCNAEKASEDAGGDTQAVVSEGGIKMDAVKAEEIRKLIATRAYEIWENEGQPHGRDLVNWRQAEHEILSCVEVGEKPASSGERQGKDRSTLRRPAAT